MSGAESVNVKHSLAMVSAIAISMAGLVFLYLYNPTEIAGIPRCPFLALTGYKCPGCGTLRGIHHLLHLQFAKAWQMNPLMIVSLPLVVAMSMSHRLRENVMVGRLVLIVVVVYCVMRNLG